MLIPVCLLLASFLCILGVATGLLPVFVATIYLLCAAVGASISLCK